MLRFATCSSVVDNRRRLRAGRTAASMAPVDSSDLAAVARKAAKRRADEYEQTRAADQQRWVTRPQMNGYRLRLGRTGATPDTAVTCAPRLCIRLVLHSFYSFRASQAACELMVGKTANFDEAIANPWRFSNADSLIAEICICMSFGGHGEGKDVPSHLRDEQS